MSSAPRCRAPARTRAAARILAVTAPLLLLLPLSGAYAEDEDREALPPPIFFSQPDQPMETDIRQLIDTSFGDRTKAPLARTQLVHRYKLLAVPQLVQQVRNAATKKSKNQSALWNAMLTLGAMRDTHGPAHQLWPAIEQINRVVTSSEIYERAFAALALGSWHWTESEEAQRKERGNETAVGRMERQMEETLRRLGDAAGDFNPKVRIAALLALAKRGGSYAGIAAKEAVARQDGGTPEDDWAGLLAQAFLMERTGAPYLRALATDDRGLKRAAGLAVAVGALQERSEELDWVRDPKRVLTAMEKVDLHPTDGPELVFARGVIIWQRQLTDRWRDLWQIAVNPRVDSEIAVAAAQALLFCGEEWFERDVLKWARGETTVKLCEPVLAGFLLLSAMQGSPEGIEAAARYLNHPGRRPKGTRHWDVRFHAAVGLARALAAGDISKPEHRTQALDALRGGLRSMHKEAPFRAALEAWLEEHGKIIGADAHYRPEQKTVRALEASFTCPFALMSRDLIDVCVHRVNELTLRLFLAHNVQPTSGDSPDKANTPLLFLRAYLEAYPYFSRLEFKWERGARKRPSLPKDDPGSLDR